MTFKAGEDFTIKGETFSEGWKSYQFKLSVLLNDQVLNSEFKFTVDTAIDCETNMTYSPSLYTSQINYLIGSTTLKNQLIFTDSKSVQTQIKDVCGPIELALNSTEIETDLIKPLPKFIKFK